MSERLEVRVGLNAGEPIEEDGDLFGATVILASRIAARAGAGEILVPDTVRGLLSGKGFVFGDRGEFVPKGFDEAVRLWDVRWRAISLEPQIRYTKTSDGVSIAYYAIGRGPALVYMPPMPMTHLELEWKVDDLREAHAPAARASTFIRYDGRGFGLSDRSATDCSLEAMVNDLEAVADAAAPGRPLGLMAAEHMAIPALALRSPSPGARWSARALAGRVERGRHVWWAGVNTLIELARSDWEFCKESVSHTIGFDSASASRAFEQLSNEAVTQESYIAFMEAMRSWDATDSLPEIRIPTLVLGSARLSSHSDRERSVVWPRHCRTRNLSRLRARRRR